MDWTSGSEIFENVTVSLMDLWNLGEKRYPEMRILQVINAIGTPIMHKIIVICNLIWVYISTAPKNKNRIDIH